MFEPTAEDLEASLRSVTLRLAKAERERDDVRARYAAVLLRDIGAMRDAAAELTVLRAAAEAGDRLARNVRRIKAGLGDASFDLVRASRVGAVLEKALSAWART
jgi:hypothetical protein